MEEPIIDIPIENQYNNNQYRNGKRRYILFFLGGLFLGVSIVIIILILARNKPDIKPMICQIFDCPAEIGICCCNNNQQMINGTCAEATLGYKKFRILNLGGQQCIKCDHGRNSTVTCC